MNVLGELLLSGELHSSQDECLIIAALWQKKTQHKLSEKESKTGETEWDNDHICVTIHNVLIFPLINRAEVHYLSHNLKLNVMCF